MGPVARIKHDVIISKKFARNVGELQCLVEFIRMRHCRELVGEVCYLYNKKVKFSPYSYPSIGPMQS